MAGPTSVNAWGWYKADALTAADNDTITTWTDSSGNARDLTGGTGIYKTGILNSLPIVRFDGVDDGYTVPDLSALTAGTAFVLVKIDVDPPGSPGQTGIWRLQTAASASHYPYTDGVIYDGAGSTTRQTVGDPTPSLSSTFRLYCVRSATNDWKAFLDGSQLFTTSTNTVGFSSTPNLGRNSDGNALDGDVAEFVIYDSALSSTDRQDVEAYFTAKYFAAPAGTPTLQVVRSALRF